MRAVRIGLALAFLLGCGRDPAMVDWTDRLLRAERKLDTGNAVGAMEDFRILERSALSAADRVHAWIRIAEVHRRTGDFSRAEHILSEQSRVARDMDRELLAKLHYYRGRVVIDSGDVERGQALLQRVMNHFPNQVFGGRAHNYLRGRVRARGEAAFLAWCQREYLLLKGTDLADNMLYDTGRTYFERETPSDDERAAEFYGVILERWNFFNGPLYDDALWDLSLIYHRRQEYALEIDLLHRLLATREVTATPLGTYQIPKYRQAVFRLGRIYYEDLGQFEDAAAEFARFREMWPSSRRKDDTLWWEAHAWKRAGNTDKAEALFARLLREYPDSKYSRRVREGHPGP